MELRHEEQMLRDIDWAEGVGIGEAQVKQGLLKEKCRLTVQRRPTVQESNTPLLN